MLEIALFNIMNADAIEECTLSESFQSSVP